MQGLQWWCSAQTTPWTWTWQWYPGVQMFVGLIALGYWLLTRGTLTLRRDRVLGWVGIATLYAALEWPVGPLAAGYLASAHAMQFLVVAFVAPPLMLLGARAGLARRFTTLRSPFSALLHPLVAAIVFNIVVIATHVPAVNDSLMVTPLGAFAIDTAWLVAGLWFWWPIIVPVPLNRLFAVPMKMLYLFLGSLVHTAIGIVMLVREHPMYGVYELAPRVSSLSAIDDLKVAGGIMELGGALIIFAVLGFMFFRWSGGSGAERARS